LEKVIVNWSIPSLNMLKEIYDFISETSLKNAANYIDGIYDFVKKLEKNPERCAFCKYQKLNKKGFRCCNVKSHVVIYQIDSEFEITILAIIHQKRSPKVFEEL